jgi:hypothetical protein
MTRSFLTLALAATASLTFAEHDVDEVFVWESTKCCQSTGCCNFVDEHCSDGASADAEECASAEFGTCLFQGPVCRSPRLDAHADAGYTDDRNGVVYPGYEVDFTPDEDCGPGTVLPAQNTETSPFNDPQKCGLVDGDQALGVTYDECKSWAGACPYKPAVCRVSACKHADEDPGCTNQNAAGSDPVIDSGLLVGTAASSAEACLELAVNKATTGAEYDGKGAGQVFAPCFEYHPSECGIGDDIAYDLTAEECSQRQGCWEYSKSSCSHNGVAVNDAEGNPLVNDADGNSDNGPSQEACDAMTDHLEYYDGENMPNRTQCMTKIAAVWESATCGGADDIYADNATICADKAGCCAHMDTTPAIQCLDPADGSLTSISVEGTTGVTSLSCSLITGCYHHTPGKCLAADEIEIHPMTRDTCTSDTKGCHEFAPSVCSDPGFDSPQVIEYGDCADGNGCAADAQRCADQCGCFKFQPSYCKVDEGSIFSWESGVAPSYVARTGLAREQCLGDGDGEQPAEQCHHATFYEARCVTHPLANPLSVDDLRPCDDSEPGVVCASDDFVPTEESCAALTGGCDFAASSCTGRRIDDARASIAGVTASECMDETDGCMWIPSTCVSGADSHACDAASINCDVPTDDDAYNCPVSCTENVEWTAESCSLLSGGCQYVAPDQFETYTWCQDQNGAAVDPHAAVDADYDGHCPSIQAPPAADAEAAVVAADAGKKCRWNEAWCSNGKVGGSKDDCDGSAFCAVYEDGQDQKCVKSCPAQATSCDPDEFNGEWPIAESDCEVKTSGAYYEPQVCVRPMVASDDADGFDVFPDVDEDKCLHDQFLFTLSENCHSKTGDEKRECESAVYDTYTCASYTPSKCWCNGVVHTQGGTQNDCMALKNCMHHEPAKEPTCSAGWDENEDKSEANCLKKTGACSYNNGECEDDQYENKADCVAATCSADCGSFAPAEEMPSVCATPGGAKDAENARADECVLGSGCFTFEDSQCLGNGCRFDPSVEANPENPNLVADCVAGMTFAQCSMARCYDAVFTAAQCSNPNNGGGVNGMASESACATAACHVWTAPTPNTCVLSSGNDETTLVDVSLDDCEPCGTFTPAMAGFCSDGVSTSQEDCEAAAGGCDWSDSSCTWTPYDMESATTETVITRQECEAKPTRCHYVAPTCTSETGEPHPASYAATGDFTPLMTSSICEIEVGGCKFVPTLPGVDGTCNSHRCPDPPEPEPVVTHDQDTDAHLCEHGVPGCADYMPSFCNNPGMTIGSSDADCQDQAGCHEWIPAKEAQGSTCSNPDGNGQNADFCGNLCEPASGCASNTDDCGHAAFTLGTAYEAGVCSDGVSQSAAECLQATGGCTWVPSWCSNGEEGGSFHDCMAATGQCAHTEMVSAQPAQCTCSDGSTGFRGDGSSQEDCYEFVEQPQYCKGYSGDQDGLTEEECLMAECFIHIPARCHDVDGTWESTSDIVDLAWCRDQDKCGVFVDSQCTNGDSGGTLEDCPTCYSFQPARCENHNDRAVDSGAQQIPFPMNLGVAVTDENCDKQKDACLFDERKCQAASEDYKGAGDDRLVSADTAEVCQAYKGGCTWNRAYTFKKPCDYTPPVEASASFCSDAANALDRMHSADGSDHSAYGVSGMDFVRLTSAPDDYTGSCFDNIQNGNEQGVDCDGTQYEVDCPPCPTTTTAAPTTTTTVAPEVVVTTTAAPTEGPVTVSPAGTVTTSLFTLVILALSALFML